MTSATERGSNLSFTAGPMFSNIALTRRCFGNRSGASKGDRPIFTGKQQFERASRPLIPVVFAVKMRQSPARKQLPILKC